MSRFRVTKVVECIVDVVDEEEGEDPRVVAMEIAGAESLDYWEQVHTQVDALTSQRGQ